MRALLLAIALLVLAPAAFPQEGDANAQRRNVVAALQKLLEQRPKDATLWYHLAFYRAKLGETAPALEAMEKVLELGDGYLPSRRDFGEIWDDARFQALRARLEAKLPRLDFAPTAFEVEDRTLLPEGIAWDPASRTFFMGSITGRILRIEEDGRFSEFIGTASGLDPLLGLAVDAPRRRLYAVTTSALTAEGRKNRRNAVAVFDIDARKQVARHDVPEATQLNDVAIAPGGRVFASDSGAGAIYEIPVRVPAAPRALVKPRALGGANGLAPSADGKRLYVGHATGIAVVDIATGEVKRVANETRESIAGIDGLYQWQGQLVGVQNVTNPGRVIVVTLSGDGERATRVQTLLSHHHTGLDEPTTGAVTDRGFYLLAATGISRFNEKGTIDGPQDVPNPRVLRVPLPR